MSFYTLVKYKLDEDIKKTLCVADEFVKKKKFQVHWKNDEGAKETVTSHPTQSTTSTHPNQAHPTKLSWRTSHPLPPAAAPTQMTAATRPTLSS